MSIKDQMQKEQQKWNTRKFWFPDSKKQFEKEGSNLQVISLATSLPDFKIKDQEKEKDFKKFLKNNWFLPTYQNLEKKLYSEGIYALGIEKQPFGKKIKIGKVLSYEIEGFTLNKLRVVVDSKKILYENIELIEEYDLQSEDNFVKHYAKSNTGKYHLIKKEFPNYQPKINTLKFIPYIIFKNRWDEKPDMDLVAPEHFELLDTLYKQLQVEGYYSNPLYLVQGNLGGTKAKKVAAALFSDDERVVETSSLSQYSLANPVEQVHGTPLSQFILQKIESVKYWIKDALFFKKNSQDGGTKNMHSLEAQNLNSNFEDYIETKANLREELFKKFVELYFKFEGIELNDEDVEVTITGSTQWLEQQAKKAQTNQQGISLNNAKGVDNE